MANSKSASKRARQNDKRTIQNRSTLTRVKSQQKRARQAITSGKKENAVAELSSVSSALDRAAKSGRIHRNAANRQKSRLNRAVAALS